MQTQTSPADLTIAIDEANRLISSDMVVGTAVYNLQREHLDSIYSLMVDKVTGQVAYAVISFGGFFGMSESYDPLPWRMLKGYVVDIDRRRLEEAPSYNAGNTPDWSDRAYGHGVDTYYGVPPYGF